MPLTTAGAEAGTTTCASTSQRRAPSIRPASMRRGGTSFEPLIAPRTMGKKADSEMRKIVAWSPQPIRRPTSGTQAVAGIGRKRLMNGSKSASIV